jgi:hypothetical protein
MERKVFWATFVSLGLIADFTLPIMWSLLATIPSESSVGGWPTIATGSEAIFLTDPLR